MDFQRIAGFGGLAFAVTVFVIWLIFVIGYSLTMIRSAVSETTTT